MGEYISWSGGKDSTASIILAYELELPPLDIVFSEVMFDIDRNISGELPEHIQFVKNVAIPKFEEWGHKVRILHSDVDYITSFYGKIKRSKIPERNRKIRGFPLGGRCYVNRDCKVKPLKQLEKKGMIPIVGIAADETKRLKRARAKGQRSLIAEQGLTEADCFELCQKYGLLSPIYNSNSRGGCWFCPNAKISEFAKLKYNYPELWDELDVLSKTENKVSERFKYNLTFGEIDKQVDEYIARLQYEQLKLDIKT